MSFGEETGAMLAEPPVATVDLGEQEKKLRPGPYPGWRHNCLERKLQNALLLVLMEINDLPRFIHFDRDRRADGDIPEHAALGFEVKILLTS